MWWEGGGAKSNVESIEIDRIQELFKSSMRVFNNSSKQVFSECSEEREREENRSNPIVGNEQQQEVEENCCCCSWRFQFLVPWFSCSVQLSQSFCTRSRAGW